LLLLSENNNVPTLRNKPAELSTLVHINTGVPLKLTIVIKYKWQFEVPTRRILVYNIGLNIYIHMNFKNINY